MAIHGGMRSGPSGVVVDGRGVLCFLAITFGVTYAIEGLLIAAGFSFS